MVSFELQVQGDISRLKTVLLEWRRGVRRDLLPLLADRIREQSRNRIRVTKKTPDGRRWLRRRSNTGRHGLLFKTRRLHNSIKSRRISADEYQVGSGLDYALWHQEGTRKMPIREFMGVGREDENQLEDALDTWTARFGSRTRALARELSAR